MNKLLFALTLSLTLPAAAQTVAPSGDAAPVQAAPAATPAIPATSAVPAWLNERGVMSLDQLLAASGLNPTPEQRARLERALNERNATLQAANARFSEALRTTFVLSNTQLETGAMQAAQDEKELRELDKIRRFQPMRYYEMKRRYDAKMKRRAEQAQPAPAQAAPPTR